MDGGNCSNSACSFWISVWVDGALVFTPLARLYDGAKEAKYSACVRESSVQRRLCTMGHHRCIASRNMPLMSH